MRRHEEAVADAVAGDEAERLGRIPSPHQHRGRAEERPRQQPEDDRAHEAELSRDKAGIPGRDAMHRRARLDGVTHGVRGMHDALRRVCRARGIGQQGEPVGIDRFACRFAPLQRCPRDEIGVGVGNFVRRNHVTDAGCAPGARDRARRFLGLAEGDDNRRAGAVSGGADLRRIELRRQRRHDRPGPDAREERQRR